MARGQSIVERLFGGLWRRKGPVADAEEEIWGAATAREGATAAPGVAAPRISPLHRARTRRERRLSDDVRSATAADRIEREAAEFVDLERRAKLANAEASRLTELALQPEADKAARAAAVKARETADELAEQFQARASQQRQSIMEEAEVAASGQPELESMVEARLKGRTVRQPKTNIHASAEQREAYFLAAADAFVTHFGANQVAAFKEALKRGVVLEFISALPNGRDKYQAMLNDIYGALEMRAVKALTDSTLHAIDLRALLRDQEALIKANPGWVNANPKPPQLAGVEEAIAVKRAELNHSADQMELYQGAGNIYQGVKAAWDHYLGGRGTFQKGWGLHLTKIWSGLQGLFGGGFQSVFGHAPATFFVREPAAPGGLSLHGRPDGLLRMRQGTIDIINGHLRAAHFLFGDSQAVGGFITRVGKGLFSTVSVGAEVLAVDAIPHELGYRMDVFDTPSLATQYFFSRAPERTFDQINTQLQGSAGQKLESAITSTHWANKPGEGPIRGYLEKFKEDGLSFRKILDEKVAPASGTPDTIAAREQAEQLLKRRDAHFMITKNKAASLKPKAEIERELLDAVERAETAAKALDRANKKDPALQATLSEKHTAAKKQLLERFQDAYVNPDVSTPVLQHAARAGLKTPADRNADDFRNLLTRMSAARDRGEIARIRQEALPLLGDTRDISLADIGIRVTSENDKKLKEIVDGSTDSAARKAMVDAYMDGKISARALEASLFDYAIKRTGIGPAPQPAPAPVPARPKAIPFQKTEAPGYNDLLRTVKVDSSGAASVALDPQTLKPDVAPQLSIVQNASAPPATPANKAPMRDASVDAPTEPDGPAKKVAQAGKLTHG